MLAVLTPISKSHCFAYGANNACLLQAVFRNQTKIAMVLLSDSMSDFGILLKTLVLPLLKCKPLTNCSYKQYTNCNFSATTFTILFIVFTLARASISDSILRSKFCLQSTKNLVDPSRRSPYYTLCYAV